MSTASPTWTTISVLGLAAGPGARAVLRTAQMRTTPGLCLDLFDPQGEDAAGHAEALRAALTERDALLVALSEPGGAEHAEHVGLAALGHVLAPTGGPGSAASPLYKMTVAVLHVGDEAGASTAVERLRRALRAGGACLMPPCRVNSASEAEHTLAALLDDVRVWATRVGCASILADE